MQMPILPDHVWEKIKPLLGEQPKNMRGGRPRMDDRACLMGVIHVLRTGVRWQRLPADMGCGSGMTCWRRLRAWQRDGTWDAIVTILKAELPDAETINWSRAIVSPRFGQRKRRLSDSQPTDGDGDGDGQAPAANIVPFPSSTSDPLKADETT
ncbi:MAG TPA: transposase [Pirellulales bacterium]|jgi:transposase|nr:transposase [Pirellulales bacterium]